MAALSDADRTEAARAFITRIYVALSQTANCNNAQIKAAIDATDDWIDSNATSFNNALPTAFRNNATTAQKTQLFCMVALKRAGLL